MSEQKSAFDRANELRAQGMPYSKIAKIMRKEGYSSKTGALTKGSTHSWLKNGTGKDIFPGTNIVKRRLKSKKLFLSTAQSSAPTKWDVLRTIDQCPEFDKETKKSILSLVWDVIYK